MTLIYRGAGKGGLALDWQLADMGQDGNLRVRPRVALLSLTCPARRLKLLTPSPNDACQGKVLR